MRASPVEDGGAAAAVPTPLLDAYRRGDFFLTGARRTILASGVSTLIHEPDVDTLSDRVDELLTGDPHAVAIGVLPFDTGRGGRHPSRMVVPRTVRMSASARSADSAWPRIAPGTSIGVRAVPEPEQHLRAVRRAVAELRAGNLRKVVLARALDLSFKRAPDTSRLVRNLFQDNADGYTFAAELPHREGRSRVLVGSTPELLVSRTGSRIFSHPHAGSARRSADPVTDRENARALLDSAKDHAEHAVLTEAVAKTLRPFCRKLSVPRQPSLTSTRTLWHLGSIVTGELIDPEVSALRLAAALHPTPAVCGAPTEAARDLVSELEPFDRGYYAGAVGWVDGTGDGEWVVAIRCAEVADDVLRLYAGGGIVACSRPETELDETTAKFRTLLRAVSPDLYL